MNPNESSKHDANVIRASTRRAPPLFESKADAVKICVGSVFGLAAFSYSLFVASSADTNSPVQVLLCIFGALIGWILGIAITPSTTGEKKQFAEYGKVLAAVGAGFIAAKFEPIMAFFQGYAPAKDGDTVALSILLFASCFLLGLLFTFIFRSYVRGSEDERRSRRAKAAKDVRDALEKLSALN